MVGAAAILGVLTVAAVHQTPQQQRLVVIPAVPAPAADSAPCQALLAKLPGILGDYSQATVAQQAPAGAAAWQATPEGEAVVLRCGLERPGEFVVGSPIQMVDAVQWFQVVNPDVRDRSTWFAVDRGVYVALTLPAGSGPTPIQEVSDVISKTMPEVPVDPRPPR